LEPGYPDSDVMGLGLGWDTKYLVKYNQKALLVLQNKFCDCKNYIHKIILRQ